MSVPNNYCPGCFVTREERVEQQLWGSLPSDREQRFCLMCRLNGRARMIEEDLKRRKEDLKKVIQMKAVIAIAPKLLGLDVSMIKEWNVSRHLRAQLRAAACKPHVTCFVSDGGDRIWPWLHFPYNTRTMAPLTWENLIKYHEDWIPLEEGDTYDSVTQKSQAERDRDAWRLAFTQGQLGYD